jgi:hypothetical protein
MNLDEPGEKQENLQQQALDMEKRGASQVEIEDKTTVASRLIAESEKPDAEIKRVSLIKTGKIKTQVIFIVVSLLVAVIVMQFIK